MIPLAPLAFPRIAAGLHGALYGAYKDGTIEGFSWQHANVPRTALQDGHVAAQGLTNMCRRLVHSTNGPVIDRNFPGA